MPAIPAILKILIVFFGMLTLARLKLPLGLAILLGGDIVFFQSMCLIGYCLFPINIAAIVCLFTKMRVRPWAGEVWGGAGALTAGWACFPLCSAATEGGRQHVHPHIDLQMQGSNRWCGLQHNRLVFGASSRLFRSGCG